MEDIIETLEEFGLQKSEAKVYLAGLKLGSSTANDIAYKANMLRTTTYEILKRLKDKGLVAEYDKDKIKYFDVIEPKILHRSLENKKKKIEKIIPFLEKIKETSAKRPKVELFSGFKGIRNLLELQLNNNEPISIIGKIELSNNFLGPHRDEYIRKRVKKKLKMSLICEPGIEAREFKKLDKKNIRITKTHQFCIDMEATHVLFGNKAAIIKFDREEPVGVLIHDKQMTKSLQIIFNEFWKAGK